MTLGTWQIFRLQWKLDLIESVESRAFGQPVTAPQREVTSDEHAYLRVSVEGEFQHDLSVRVKALTELGGGHWIVTPLVTVNGTVWVNRGFAPSGTDASELTRPGDVQTVVGLLRITEPEGTVLERNDPEAGRWVSRDVIALSASAGIDNSYSYFIDAEHAGPGGTWPRGGMTIVSFRNNHLSYALTWFAMAALLAGGMVYVIRDHFKRPRLYVVE